MSRYYELPREVKLEEIPRSNNKKAMNEGMNSMKDLRETKAIKKSLAI
jgi:hypothetical protein